MITTTGQNCEDCMACNLTAEECIDGFCRPDVGNECAALGENRQEPHAAVRYSMQSVLLSINGMSLTDLARVKQESTVRVSDDKNERTQVGDTALQNLVVSFWALSIVLYSILVGIASC